MGSTQVENSIVMPPEMAEDNNEQQHQHHHQVNGDTNTFNMKEKSKDHALEAKSINILSGGTTNSSSNTTINNSNGTPSIDGANSSGIKNHEQLEPVTPEFTSSVTSSDVMGSLKRKDGSVGDVVDNEKEPLPQSLDSEQPEETSKSVLSKRTEINIDQILSRDNQQRTTTTTTTTTTSNTTTGYPQELDESHSSNNSLDKLNTNHENVVQFENLDQFKNENNDDIIRGSTSSSLDSPSRSRLNTSQRLKLNKLKSEKRLSHRPKSTKLEHKKNVLGEIIYKGHSSWVLMLNIQTGIRNSVGKSMTSDNKSNHMTLRKPTEFKKQEEFYMSPKTLRFDSAGSPQTNAHSTSTFKFKDYCPHAFRYLRYLFGIDTADFMVSLCNTLKNGENALRELPTPGKSGSLFFFSHDMRFILKTIPKDEAKLLRSLLPSYLEHIHSNPNSLLPRFFGLYRVKPHGGRQVRFVVMGNNFPTKKIIHERYDLKGSTVGREASAEEKKSESVTLKDLDFRSKNKKIHMGPEKRKTFLEQIEKDCKLLQSLNIMDYSLLVGIHQYSRVDPPSPTMHRNGGLDESTMDLENIISSGGIGMSGSLNNMGQSQGAGSSTARSPSLHETQEVYISVFQQDEGGIRGMNQDNQPIDEHYFLGIIDILMLYSLRKKLEHTYKSIKFGSKQEISSISPDEYAQRFKDFLSSVVV